MFFRNRARIRSLKQSLQYAQDQREQLEDKLSHAQKKLSIAESRLKDKEAVIQTLKDDLHKAQNQANARLSLVIGIKRYLDNFFQTQEDTPEYPAQTNKCNSDASEPSSDS